MGAGGASLLKSPILQHLCSVMCSVQPRWSTDQCDLHCHHPRGSVEKLRTVQTHPKPAPAPVLRQNSQWHNQGLRDSASGAGAVAWH